MELDDYQVAAIARATHQVNRAYRAALCEPDTGNWAEQPFQTVQGVMNGVRAHLANTGISDLESHNNWLKSKKEQGWVYGPVQDNLKKIHPCCIAYEDLPPDQRAKDAIFGAVIKVVAPLV